MPLTKANLIHVKSYFDDDSAALEKWKTDAEGFRNAEGDTFKKDQWDLWVQYFAGLIEVNDNMIRPNLQEVIDEIDADFSKAEKIYKRKVKRPLKREIGALLGGQGFGDIAVGSVPSDQLSDYVNVEKLVEVLDLEQKSNKRIVKRLEK